MRPIALLLLLSAAALVPVHPPASAKGGVRATLEAPVRLDTPAGERVRVQWRLSDGEDQPFGASGIYLRVSRCGAKPLRIRARTLGGGKVLGKVRGA